MPLVFLNAVLGAILGIGLARLILANTDVPLQFAPLRSGLEKTPHKAAWLFQLVLGFLMALVFALNASLLNSESALLYWQLMAGLMISAAVYDLMYRLIPVLLMVAMLIVAVLSPLVLNEPLLFADALVGAVSVGGVVGALYLFTRGRGIGEADVLLAVVVGLMFGWMRGLIVFSAANFLGLLVILPLIVLLGKNRMRQIPLVFFIVLAMMLEWYVDYTDPVLLLMGAS